jgi:hypothetical protein
MIAETGEEGEKNTDSAPRGDIRSDEEKGNGYGLFQKFGKHSWSFLVSLSYESRRYSVSLSYGSRNMKGAIFCITSDHAMGKESPAAYTEMHPRSKGI